MLRAKSIQQLYDEVKDYDLVICNDQELATALNCCGGECRLGVSAIVPRRYVLDNYMDFKKYLNFPNKKIVDEIELIRNVMKDTGYGLKYVHGEISNIHRMMRYIGIDETDPGKEDRIKENLNKKPQKVWDSLKKQNTVENLLSRLDMEKSGYFHGKRIAVIGDEMFDQLEKHFLPSPGNIDEIEPFLPEEEYKIEEIRVLGNDRQSADCAIDIVKSAKNFNDVAIVLDTEDSIIDAVKSSLHRNFIPFINPLETRNIGHVREFIEYLSLSLRYETLRVDDVKQLFAGFGGHFDTKYGGYSLQALFDGGFIKDSKAKLLTEIMSSIRYYKYKEVVESFKKSCLDQDKANDLFMILNDLKINDDYIDEDGVQNLRYAVDNIKSLRHSTEEDESEKTGVLLVDCKNSMYIDRPVVIYVGLSTNWNRDVKSLHYLSPGKKKDEDEYNRKRFEILLQQGDVRFYLANSTRKGKKTVPCAHFSSGSETKDFSSLCDRIIEGSWLEDSNNKDDKKMNIESKPFVKRSWSKSSYSEFKTCPRKYMFSKLVGSPDKVDTYTGNILHQYAQFLASYPENEMDPNTIADMISKKCDALYSYCLKDSERTSIINIVENMHNFFRSKKITPSSMRLLKNKEENIFLPLIEKDSVSVETEMNMEFSEKLMKGTFDLLHGDTVYDYKTGKEDEAKALYDGMNYSNDKIAFDFQALFYLSMMEEYGIKNPVFSLLYFNSGKTKMMKGENKDVISPVKVKIYESKIECIRVASPDLLDAKDYNKIDLEEILPLFEKYDNPTSDNGSFVDAVQEKFGVSEKKAKKAIDKICKEMEKSMIPGDHILAVPRDYLNTFREDLSESMDKLEEYYSSKFPMDSERCSTSCKYYDMCVESSVEEDAGGDE